MKGVSKKTHELGVQLEMHWFDTCVRYNMPVSRASQRTDRSGAFFRYIKKQKQKQKRFQSRSFFCFTMMDSWLEQGGGLKLRRSLEWDDWGVVVVGQNFPEQKKGSTAFQSLLDNHESRDCSRGYLDVLSKKENKKKRTKKGFHSMGLLCCTIIMDPWLEEEGFVCGDLL